MKSACSSHYFVLSVRLHKANNYVSVPQRKYKIYTQIFASQRWDRRGTFYCRKLSALFPIAWAVGNNEEKDLIGRELN